MTNWNIADNTLPGYLGLTGWPAVQKLVLDERMRSLIAGAYD